MDFDTKIKYPLNKLLKEHDNEALIFKENITADFFNINKDKRLTNPFYNSKFNKCFCQYFLIFKKEHPILKKTIELIIRNIKEERFKNDIHKTTGPYVFTEAVQHFVKMHSNNCMESFEKTMNRTLQCKNFDFKLLGYNYLNQYIVEKRLYFKISEIISMKHWRVEQKQIPLLK
jgi:mannosyltransferase OCH1-like enzyme